jgi:hypothetical protein
MKVRVTEDEKKVKPVMRRIKGRDEGGGGGERHKMEGD